MPQPTVIASNFQTVCNREYWLTQSGERKFPHELNDEQLADTIRYLSRMTRTYRLTEARNVCAVVYRTGNRDADPSAYYNAYKRQMNEFLGDLDDKQWLKENSKIYCLLVDEATFRGVDFSDKPSTIKYNKKIEYNATNRFRDVFTNLLRS